MPPGWLQLDDAQRHNLHAEHNERYEFKTFEPTAGDRLAEVELEARLMQPAAAAELVRLDARAVVKALKQRCIGHVLAVGEVILLTVAGHELRLRVAQTDTADAGARDELVAYHCFRGVLAPETDVYLHAMQDREDAAGSALGSLSRGGGLELTDCPLRPPSVPSANRVTVNCNDDEFFLVHKQVLRPCITLTGAVRAAGPSGGSEVQVDVSCLVFDRVLLFLEAEAQARPTPEFGINLLDELLDAARKLGLRSLEDYCATRLGEFSSRLREYSFAEIKQRNAAGECLIIVDGMVLDVTRWLPEHPGGSTIIPTQALNMDAARFYEVYHASRESFLYVKSFYIGERVRCSDWHARADAPPRRRDFTARPRTCAAARAGPVGRVHRAAQGLHHWLPAARHRRLQELLKLSRNQHQPTRFCVATSSPPAALERKRQRHSEPQPHPCSRPAR